MSFFKKEQTLFAFLPIKNCLKNWELKIVKSDSEDIVLNEPGKSSNIFENESLSETMRWILVSLANKIKWFLLFW